MAAPGWAAGLAWAAPAAGSRGRRRRAPPHAAAAPAPEVGGHAGVEEGLQYPHHPLRVGRRHSPETVADKVDNLLVGLDIPDTIAAYHYKLVVFCPVEELNVRSRAYDLLLRLSCGVLLVLEVPKSPRQVEVAVHAVLARRGVLDEAAGRLYPAPLGGTVRLVVLAKGDGTAAAAEDRSAVARVRHDKLALGDAAETRGAANEVHVNRPTPVYIPSGHRLRARLVRQGLQLRAACLPVSQELVHAVEGADQGRLQVASRSLLL
mmetsp:Transcript_1664/g.5682  ORF Transcript_1664/g.5682 Transcript_1664/m.5682 type:complete len:263 (-) Transcript_1664:357-1145(-)